MKPRKMPKHGSLKSYSLLSIPSIVYLILSGIKIHGLGNISAVSLSQNHINFQIKAKKGCAIGKKVIIKAPLKMEEDVYIDDECYIKAGPITIGRGTNIMFRSEVVGPVTIGRYCAIARNTIFQAENHLMTRPSIQRKLYRTYFKKVLPSSEKKGIEIGSDVWIGTQSVILSGVTIGHGAIIGAGSIVTKDVEPYSIVAGNPAQFKRWRFSSTIRNQLLDVKWWNWTKDKIKRNKEFFLSDLTKINELEPLIVE